MISRNHQINPKREPFYEAAGPVSSKSQHRGFRGAGGIDVETSSKRGRGVGYIWTRAGCWVIWGLLFFLLWQWSVVLARGYSPLCLGLRSLDVYGLFWNGSVGKSILLREVDNYVKMLINVDCRYSIIGYSLYLGSIQVFWCEHFYTGHFFRTLRLFLRRKFPRSSIWVILCLFCEATLLHQSHNFPQSASCARKSLLPLTHTPPTQGPAVSLYFQYFFLDRVTLRWTRCQRSENQSSSANNQKSLLEDPSALMLTQRCPHSQSRKWFIFNISDTSRGLRGHRAKGKANKWADKQVFPSPARASSPPQCSSKAI